jgi:hypothetical protein
MEMHKQTQSIHQQSDQYADESELPFTVSPALSAGDGALPDVEAARRVDTKGEPRDERDSAAG